MIVELGRHVQTHHVGLDGNLAMAAIDQDRQADARRSTQVADGIQGCANRPACEQDIVHQHDLGPIEVKRDIGPSQHGPALRLPEIVAIERDVDGADIDILPDQPAQLLRQPLGQRNPARPNAHQVERHIRRGGPRQACEPSTRSGHRSHGHRTASARLGSSRPRLRVWETPGRRRWTRNVAETRACFQAWRRTVRRIS